MTVWTPPIIPYLETNPQISALFCVSMLSLWKKLYQAHTLLKPPQNKTEKTFCPPNPKNIAKSL